jgi:hypothetical protein
VEPTGEATQLAKVSFAETKFDDLAGNHQAEFEIKQHFNFVKLKVQCKA